MYLKELDNGVINVTLSEESALVRTKFIPEFFFQGIDLLLNFIRKDLKIIDYVIYSAWRRCKVNQRDSLPLSSNSVFADMGKSLLQSASSVSLIILYTSIISPLHLLCPRENTPSLPHLSSSPLTCCIPGSSLLPLVLRCLQYDHTLPIARWPELHAWLQLRSDKGVILLQADLPHHGIQLLSIGMVCLLSPVPRYSEQLCVCVCVTQLHLTVQSNHAQIHQVEGNTRVQNIVSQC